MAARSVRKTRPGKCWHASCSACYWTLCATSWRKAYGYATKHVCGFR